MASEQDKRKLAELEQEMNAWVKLNPFLWKKARNEYVELSEKLREKEVVKVEEPKKKESVSSSGSLKKSRTR